MKRTKWPKGHEPRPLLQEFTPLPGAPFQVCPVWEGSCVEAGLQRLLQNPEFARGLEDYLKEWGFLTLREPLEALAELNERVVEQDARIQDLEQDRYVVVDTVQRNVVLCENWKDAIETLWGRLNTWPASKHWQPDCNLFELEEGDEVELLYVGDEEEVPAAPRIEGLRDFLDAYFETMTALPPTIQGKGKPPEDGLIHVSVKGERLVCACGGDLFRRSAQNEFTCIKCKDVYVGRE